MIKLFGFNDYREYLVQALNAGGERGRRSRLAAALRCQPAFVSRVLAGDAHFSQEHGIVINSFLHHSDEESEFFMGLLDLGRAGSLVLRQYHQRRLETIRARRREIAERIGVKQSLS